MMELEKLVHFDGISLSLSVIKPIQHLVLPKSFRFSFFFSSTNTLGPRERVLNFTSSKYGQTCFFGSRYVHPLSTTHPTHYNTHTYTHTHFLPIVLRSPPLAQRCPFPPPPILHPNLTRHSNIQFVQIPMFSGSNQSSLNTVRSFLIGDL